MPALAPRSHRRGRRTINEINMVPFIDVMLVLLIIFMVTAPLISPSLIQLPSVGKADARPPEVIQIVIEKDESMELKSASRSMPVTVNDVVDAVHQAQGSAADSADIPVVISADRSVRYEAVVKVMGKLQSAGIKRVGLSVQLAK
ncbi:MAG: Tol biopolymer transport system, TolR protein [Burkholderiaceae bacterium]|jgi:biopolymer transport protein TolR|nr:MAG: Tol biopolymer transport system, TolR protein [Burkholderiaceae bacterium]